METNNEIFKGLRRNLDLYNEAIDEYQKENNLSVFEFAEKYSTDQSFQDQFEEYAKNYKMKATNYEFDEPPAGDDNGQPPLPPVKGK